MKLIFESSTHRVYFDESALAAETDKFYHLYARVHNEWVLHNKIRVGNGSTGHTEGGGMNAILQHFRGVPDRVNQPETKLENVVVAESMVVNPPVVVPPPAELVKVMKKTRKAK